MRSWFLAIGLCLLLCSYAGATRFSYVTGITEPWGQSGGVHAMDNVFGLGSWDHLDFSITDLFSRGYDFIYLDGSGSNAIPFLDFISFNWVDLHDFVADGGSVFLNAATWSDHGYFSLGFGVSSYYNPSSTGVAVDPNHKIFDGFSSPGNIYGSSLSQNSINAGVPLLVDSRNRTILSEMNYGQGHVLFGGLTFSYFGEHDLWNPDSDILRDNIIAYAADYEPAPVPEPSTILLLGSGLAGLAWIKRKKGIS